MDQENGAVAVVVIDSSGWQVANNLNVDTATTLIALASEDPGDWAEAMGVWPRYRTPAVCEFVSCVPLEQTDSGDAMNRLLSAEAFVVVDFCDKRVLIGGDFMPVGRDAAFAMSKDESGKQHCPLSVHLPPWWELREGVSPDAVNDPRQTPINKPYVDREVLFGDALLADIAARVLQTVQTDAWKESEASGEQQARYPFTISVHRDWLMTPREDLDGRTPRELLHGAQDWSDQVTWGQRMRFEDGGPMVAAPDDWDGFETAPMGSQEMILYFDLCRELIGAAWFWCESEQGTSTRANRDDAANELVGFLRGVRDEWHESPFEGGSPPRFMIECGRRRVPRGAGVTIEGIDAVQTEQHIADCDCPICEMMADGLFGVGFTSLDGHHLDLDDEFAFSIHETREAWEEQQREYAEFNAEMDRKHAEREAAGYFGDEQDDPLASAWSGIQDDRPLPGDAGGHLKMAFMVAEIVSDLERLDASREEIQSLNACFANYRRADEEHLDEEASRLKANLQTLAEHHQELLSKSADLQSRIDEAQRTLATPNDDPDVPF
ncbi:hypothetical protein LF1_32520 [Rubripirellula obstinata]|uniref:Uncharacterized protein n=1 Tax=Rubripirellula obstinata TaxID=406547 RepID=A0A5B1CK81_9BACT|nr:hypothetical protein [Rubripirellula obstinata]KAA1260711.1 hypothetical protein LF1_32520 [Rubripirellula obstinata]